MLNKVLLIGNLGRDPEVRSTPSGQPVASFTLATNRRWRDKSGARQEQTEWHNIVVWGRQAEIAGQYLTKGKQIYLEGRLQTRSWEDRGECHEEGDKAKDGVHAPQSALFTGCPVWVISPKSLPGVSLGTESVVRKRKKVVLRPWIEIRITHRFSGYE